MMIRQRLKHGVFHSVVDLHAAMNRCINEHNQRPRPSIWKADPDQSSPPSDAGTKRWNQSTSFVPKLARNTAERLSCKL
jgi:hypothetical protein